MVTASTVGLVLETVIETEELKWQDNAVNSNRDIDLNGTEPVSMNMWGFTPDLFVYLKSMFKDFLDKEGSEMKSEYLIPSVVNALIEDNKKQVKVLRSSSSWFGVTYINDKPYVVQKIEELVRQGLYPKKLF